MKFLYIIFSTILFSSDIKSQVQPDHIVLLILENHGTGQIVGNASAPYLNSLLTDPQTVFLTNSHGLTHPSQPNYVRLFSGAEQGVFDNSVPLVLPFVTPNLGASLLQNGFTFKTYSQSLPSVGFTGASSFSYARKHNPMVNWQGNGVNGIPDTCNQPYTAFPADFNQLPTVSIVVPDMDYDMHDGTIDSCDTWVQRNLNACLQWCKTHNSIFIVTFDEDNGTVSNDILTTVTGEHIQKGNFNQNINHYNVLRTIEELYRLPYAGYSADSSAIKNIWKTTELCNNGNITLTTKATGTLYQWQVNTGSGFTLVAPSVFNNGINSPQLTMNSVPSSSYGYKYRCVVDGVAGDETSLKFTNYWKVTPSTAWSNPNNWSCGLPDTNTDIIVNGGTVELTSATSVRSLTIRPGAVFVNKVGSGLVIRK